MLSITCVIVEDSELARFELKNLVATFEQLEIIGEASDVESAITLIGARKPDLVFMDIDLAGGTAFDILSALPLVPKLIFTTAFDQFALQAFEHNTIDYLLKPIKLERLQTAIKKLEPILAGDTTPDSNSPAPLLNMAQSIFVKDGDKCRLIQLKDVFYIEALGNYCRIHFQHGVITHSASLSSIEEKLDNLFFFKISRSCIVQLACIQHIEPWVSGGFQITIANGAVLEVSRRQAAKFKQQLIL